MIGRYLCAEDLRLRVVKRAGLLNGIEYLDVADTAQRTLLVRLLKPAAGIKAEEVRIDGGERIATVGVEWVSAADSLPSGEDPALVAGLDSPGQVLVVRTAQAGDFSYYTLHIGTTGFDPILAQVRFTFKIACAGGFDCRDGKCRCGTARPTGVPELDYLAKDYQSLRRMLLDRLSLVTPRWRERSPADLGMTLVELLAYAGDRLSYRQDAHATDAYFTTARSRIALRRHARLVDYRMHDGCSSRVLLRFTVPLGGAVQLPKATRVYSKVEGLPPMLGPQAVTAALNAGAVVFETVDHAVLYADHDEIPFYAWGNEDCCLPAGSTAATLSGDHPDLKAGDLLVFATPDRLRRHPVRLVHVTSAQDPSGGLFKDTPDNNPLPVTEIVWEAADALPFDLPINGRVSTDPVAVAWGNIVVADHGRRAKDDELGVVGNRRYRPRLRYAPLTRSVPVTAKVIATTDADAAVQADLALRKSSQTVRDWLARQGVVFKDLSFVVRGNDGEWSVSNTITLARITVLPSGKVRVTQRPMPAARLTEADAARAEPAITLVSKQTGEADTGWSPQWDLLGSGPDATDFAVETEHDGTAYLRFGDGEDGHGHGRRPAPGTAFVASYRLGNGVSGNVGAHSLEHLEQGAAATAVTNPLPAAGGLEQQTADEVRRDAPEAFLIQERAVTPADWAEVAVRDPLIQRAAATWRWTGSWHTVFLTVDPIGGGAPDSAFEARQRERLERYRLAGYDLEIDAPHYIPVELELHVCVAAGHHRSAVRQEVIASIEALFHADRLSFAQPVYLSPIYAATQAVPGVESVNIVTFRRQHDPAVSGLDTGVLTMGRLEIARLENNRNFPERGVLSLTVGGGR
ncbi:hypothetical protein Rhe02_49250 [Rhizocola hellebori]|uniref:Baseplate assembly protein n=1 Tax=Rhizocola hellebori TaxID=1392758 RepID=A0A8J3Q9Y0_9ACTN|nr:putative baseplate assembly protein [Rhizocola hellebori]GIH06858.1 hypothetical protein Rhe02_49250 [Rhizocola hellebori]